MQSSNIPAKFPIPFAFAAGAGYIRTVPTASQIGITNGAASLTDGYPPLNSIQQAVGGVPPFMQDTNGILNQTTSWARWFSAGGPVMWDSTFSAAIGGYPMGSVVMSATTFGLAWISTVENNTTNPDIGGAGWLARGGWAGASMAASGSFVVPATVSVVKVRAVGGGGGGANCQATSGNYLCGAGGGAGGYGEGLYAVTPSGTYAVTVGAGGAAQTSGGTSSFGSLLAASGGSGATFQIATSSAGALGGNSSGGTLINATGADGGDGQSGTWVFSGYGGNGPWGGGGRAAKAGGIAGHAPGAGGGGAYDSAISNTAYSGGAGANGLVIVEWLP